MSPVHNSRMISVAVHSQSTVSSIDETRRVALTAVKLYMPRRPMLKYVPDQRTAARRYFPNLAVVLLERKPHQRLTEQLALILQKPF